MSNSNTSLTKTCVSCGVQKPLSAFLQISGTQGTTYGNVCASCRKTNIEKAPKPTEPEESTTSTTGVKIDSKTKVKAEFDKREYRKQVEEDYFEERDKKDEKHTHRTQKTENISQDEKKHRNSFLEKRSFLDSSKKSNTSNPSQVFGGETQQTAAGKLDFATGPVEYTRVAGLVKVTQSPIFQSFKSWLGNAPIVSAAEKAAQQKNKTQPTPAADKEPLNEYLDKRHGPGSKK
jgi:hypothetical protein